jgi:hypothetical protein
MSGVVIAATCSFCSKPRPPLSVHRMVSGQTICEDCVNWHVHALDFLGGAPPNGCQECGKTWDAMRAESPALDMAVRVFIVAKDGIYQMLCAQCARAYVPKTPNLYKGTKFGSEVLHL